MYGKIRPPASFKGDNTGLDLKLGQVGRLNLTRQSLGLSSLNAATALTTSPTPSTNDIISPSLAALPRFAKLLAEFNAFETELTAFPAEVSVDARFAPVSNSPIIFCPFGIIFS